MIPLSRDIASKLCLFVFSLALFLAVSHALAEGTRCYAQDAEQRFGLALPSSGLAKPLGEGLRKGIDLALEEVNKRTAQVAAQELNYYFEDTQCLDFEAQRAAEVILKTMALKVIVGPVCTSAILAVNEVRREYPSILIAPVTMTGLSAGDGMTFHLWGDWTYIMDRLAIRIRELLQVKSLTIVGVGTPYSESLAKKFAGHAKGAGIKLYPSVTSSVSPPELRASFLNALKDQPEAMFLAVRPALLPKLLKELDQISPEGVKLIAAPGLFTPQSQELPKALDLYFPVGWHNSMSNPESRAFVEAYRTRYDEIPHSELPVWGYAAVLALSQALTLAPLSDPVQLAQALSTNEVDTPAGKMRFDKRGFANMPVRLAQWHKGAWKTLD